MRWEVVKENKKVRKHAFNQESDQKKEKKKKTRSRPRNLDSKEGSKWKTQIRFKHLA